jgi:hypothetical protein
MTGAHTVPNSMPADGFGLVFVGTEEFFVVGEQKFVPGRTEIRAG